MLCDAHIHFIPQDLSEFTSFYKGIWTQKDKLFEFIDSNNIEKALLVYPSTDAHLKLDGYDKVCQIYNDAVEGVLKEKSNIVAAGLINPQQLDSIDLQVKDLAKRGFKAISLASSYDGKFIVKELFGLFEAAQSNNLSIFIHPQTINPIGFERIKDPLLMPVLEYSFDISMFLGLLMMEGVLDKFNIKFIFSSLGGVTPFLKDRFDRVYSMLRKRAIVKDLGSNPSEILKNVYVDTSGSSLQNIKLAIDLFGEDNILWGSDYPVCGPVKENISMLDALGKEVKEKIAYKNFSNLFK